MRWDSTSGRDFFPPLNPRLQMGSRSRCRRLNESLRSLVKYSRARWMRYQIDRVPVDENRTTIIISIVVCDRVSFECQRKQHSLSKCVPPRCQYKSLFERYTQRSNVTIEMERRLCIYKMSSCFLIVKTGSIWDRWTDICLDCQRTFFSTMFPSRVDHVPLNGFIYEYSLGNNRSSVHVTRHVNLKWIRFIQ